VRQKIPRERANPPAQPGPRFARRAAAGKEPMETHDPLDHALQECEDKVKELEEENQHLRESSHAFGQLAERLNQTLQQERRVGAERRQSQRPSGDRRNHRPVIVPRQSERSHDRE